MNKQKEVALQYVKAGIQVFPADAKTKKPLVKDGFYAATDDSDQISQWFDKHPDALIGSPCEGQFSIIDVDLKKKQAFESFSKIFEYANETNSRVTTGSNGSHYYFKPDNELTRKINFIPDIDLLGKGGYAILPDDNTYKQSGSLESFIESLNNLPSLNNELKDHITGESEIESLSLYREAHKPTRKKSETYVEKSTNEDEESEEAKIVEEKERILSEKTYETSGRRSEHFIDFDGTPLQFEQGSIDSDTVNALFYNKAIQKRLANFLGLKLPKNNEKTSSSFRSIFPSHDDENPSFGSRWAESSKGNHLIIRDFSDHYQDGFTDYNVVRLYATTYKGKTRHLSSPEFYVWFMRLLDEAGVIEIQKPEFEGNTENLSNGEKKVAQGFVDLMSYKSLYKNGNSETAFANKFAASWCNVSTSMVSRAKCNLIRYGCMKKTGMHGEGFFACSLFTFGDGVINRSEITKKDVNAVFKEDMAKKDKQNKKRTRLPLGERKNDQSQVSDLEFKPITYECYSHKDFLNKLSEEKENRSDEDDFERSLKDPDDNNPSRKRSAQDELEDVKKAKRRVERKKGELPKAMKEAKERNQERERLRKEEYLKQASIKASIYKNNRRKHGSG